KNRLFRNEYHQDRPEAGFSDVTGEAGVAGDPAAWSSSAAWIDYDNDGDLDLLVANYIRWSKDIDLDQNYTLVGVGRAYGPPTHFAGSHPYLYRNEGNGHFVDVTHAAGLKITNEATGLPMAKSLGLAPVDLDSDGWIDILIANDTVRNLVFHNRGDGTFEEIGVVAGIAYDSTGQARGAMGVDTLRFGAQGDGHGDLAVGIGNFSNEMTAFYCTHGDPLLFSDDAIATGIGPRTRLVLTFGLLFFDSDLDGRRDLLAVNGHLEEDISRVQESQHYRQSAQLFFNVGGSARIRFVPATETELGPDFFTPLVGRGATYADIDADGDLDLLLTQIAGPPRLLRNDQALRRHWIRLKLVGHRSNRSAIGARVRVQFGKRVVHRQVMPTRSYLSQVELPVTVGLGEQTGVDKITIHWPGGEVQTLADIPIDCETTIAQE
ncbi:MAG: CRTAC1 family protein, partial [Halocynthiibacter sp.]